MKPTGRLVILSGPSGVGKDTVIDAWRALDPRVKRVVAYTTRSPRPGEQQGVDYHFVTRDRFDAMARERLFLEHKEVHGNGYATPLADMEELLDNGCIAVLKIDVQGALEVERLRPEAVSIFLLPPSLEVLEQRIRGRMTEDEAAIEKRLANARKELEAAGCYEHLVVNDDLDRAVGQMREILANHA